MRSLLMRAGQLAASTSSEMARPGLEPSEAGRLQLVANRLTRSVTRPLGVALTRLQGGDGAAPEPPGDEDVPAAGVSIDDRLWELARDATRLRLAPGLPAEVQEAVAALQDLATRPAPGAGPERRVDRVAELRALQAALQRRIQLVPRGPYVTTNVETLTNWLGERFEALPQMALCRCGRSSTRPFCDGTHADTDFVDTKDERRVPDRRDTYAGVQVTLLDNRGICQHSGFCTDRLATVFRLHEEPFVAPSGGRMDEIIRAVRDCPSGALSFALDGHEAREAVDHGNAREPTIEVSRNGPYRIQGGIPLVEADGSDVPRNQGASLEHYALCRCGSSLNKPFCSGMHWDVGFECPVQPPDHEPTIFEWAGGFPALLRMTRLFYEKYIPQDPLLAPLFAEMAPDHPERVASWLGEVFCGPKAYSGRYGGYTRMISQHIGKAITEEKRARWAQLMVQAAIDAGLPNDPEFRSTFASYIEWGSRLAVENSTPGARPPEHMPMPHWDWFTAAGPPGSRIPALRREMKEAPARVVLPGPDETVTWHEHVKNLFRPQDRRSMQFAFDLGSYEDVKRHAAGILARVAGGTMPCDGKWPDAWVETFRRWVDSSMKE